MPTLILGPMLRYVGETEATVWVEVDSACEVEVLGHTAPTFEVEGHHYALVYMRDLAPATLQTYTVRIDGQCVWPEPNSPFPPCVIQTFDKNATLRVAFGSCRVAMPHEPPYTLTHAENEKQGFEIDALRALALRMREQAPEQWPHALLMIGDQLYADEVSPPVRDWIRARRDTSQPPCEQLANFEEYTQLYRDSWGQAEIRWLLSTVPSVMIFDDHDVHDDWNISESWVKEMRAKPWWHDRIVGSFMSYWIYQHVGNLSPHELHEDELFDRVRRGDAPEQFARHLREFAQRADREPDTYRWSFYRDFGDTRLVVVDSRSSRVLGDGCRDMIDEKEWQWVEARTRGEFTHLMLGTSLPILLGHGIHYLEAWSEALCAGAWGGWWAKQGERLRRWLDLEHWSAFGIAFKRIVNLIRQISTGEHGHASATLTILSGDVHHVYLAEAKFPQGPVHSAVYQAVCSPLRNPLDANDRRIMRAGWSRWASALMRSIARMAGVGQPDVSWSLCHDEPWFDNQIAILSFKGPEASICFEKSVPGDATQPRLEKVFEYRLNKTDVDRTVS